MDEQKQTDVAPEQRAPRGTLFVLYGYGYLMRMEVERFLQTLELTPVIVRDETIRGKTIADLFEIHTDVAFVIVLLSADDEIVRRELNVVQLGGFGRDLLKLPDPPEKRWRVHQETLFEWGYCAAKVEPGRIAVLYHPDVALPFETEAARYIRWDAQGAWHRLLAEKMKAAGLDVDLFSY